MTKAELRKACLARRQLLTPAERETASAKIIAAFFASFELSKIKVLHCFIPIVRFNEVDTRPLFQHIWNQFPHVQTVVPRVNHGTEEVESLRYGPEVELVESRWHISEPTHDERIEPGEVDLVLVPLLCFDRRGHRVGYGKGYYDRFLGRCRSDCIKVGLSIFEPVDEITDAHAGDITLDKAITPNGKIDLPQK